MSDSTTSQPLPPTTTEGASPAPAGSPKQPAGAKGNEKKGAEPAKGDDKRAEAGPTGPRAPSSQTAAMMRNVRRNRARRFAWRFGLVVMLPTLIAALYFGLFASQRYQTTIVLAVHTTQASSGLEGALITGGKNPLFRDTNALLDRLESPAMFWRLDKDLNLRAHFSDTSIDPFSRLPKKASKETCIEFYHSLVQATYDDQKGSIRVDVETFSPELTEKLANELIKKAEYDLAAMSEKVKSERMAAARAEVDRARLRLRDARLHLRRIKVQSDRNTQRAGGKQEAATTTTVKLPAVAALPSSATLASSAPSATPALIPTEAETREFDLEDAEADRAFAERAYEAASTNFENAQTEVAKAHQLLVVLVPPSRPQDASHPEVLKLVAQTFLLSLLILGVGGLIVAAIREHARM